PVRVAVVGSGPAGFYATEQLLRLDDVAVEVDLFDRLPTPFGLVRAGVAPDHPKLKSVIRVYEKTAARDGFRFFGNVTAGPDLADHAIEALAESRVREIVVLGRRGPAQAAFTNPEVRELGEMTDADVVVDPADAKLDRLSDAYLASDEADMTARKNVEIVREF